MKHFEANETISKIPKKSSLNKTFSRFKSPYLLFNFLISCNNNQCNGKYDLPQNGDIYTTPHSLK